MKWIKHLALGYQTLIVVGILMMVVVALIFIMALFKPVIHKDNMVNIYAFGTGFLIVLAILGLLGGSIHELNEYFEKDHSVSRYLITIAIIVFGAIFGFIISFYVKHLILKHSSEIHNEHNEHISHNHDEHIINLNSIDNPKNKWTAIALLTLHRIPAGLTLGLLVAGFHDKEIITIGILLAFVIHVIPEVMIVYYRQTAMGMCKWKAALSTLLMQSIIVPMVFIGSFLGAELISVFWILPFILVAAGAIMTYTSIIELVPEFIHTEMNHKKWTIVVTLLMIGFILAAVLLIFHGH